MPTLTLRLSKEQHEQLMAMAEFKRVSLSDLARRYLREGLRIDAEDLDLETVLAEYERCKSEVRDRLLELRQMLQQTLTTAESSNS